MATGTQRLYVGLFGKTGHGKSSTGNTILRRQAFDNLDNTEIGTQLLDMKSNTFNERPVSVFDTPGLMKCEISEKKDIERAYKIINDMMEVAVSLAAILLVYRFNTRFTHEEKRTVEILEKLIGRSHFERHCIVVVTYGDELDTKVKPGETSESCLKNWYNSSDNKELKEIIHRMGDRVVLVYNKDSFTEGKRLQSSELLLDAVVKLVQRNGFYTKEEFHKQNSWCSLL